MPEARRGVKYFCQMVKIAPVKHEAWSQPCDRHSKQEYQYGVLQDSDAQFQRVGKNV